MMFCKSVNQNHHIQTLGQAYTSRVSASVKQQVDYGIVVYGRMPWRLFQVTIRHWLDETKPLIKHNEIRLLRLIG